MTSYLPGTQSGRLPYKYAEKEDGFTAYMILNDLPATPSLQTGFQNDLSGYIAFDLQHTIFQNSISRLYLHTEFQNDHTIKFYCMHDLYH